MSIFPRQDIPSIQKTIPLFYKPALDYAEDKVKYNKNLYNAHMSDLYNSYNGIATSADSVRWLTHTYGQENKAKYIRYRLGRTKIKLLHGEWLRRPLSATVQTINSDAVSQKMQQYNFLKGAMIAKPELEEIRDKVGVDVTEGVPIPEDDNDPIWQKMSFKDKNEEIMQLILDEQVKTLNVKKKIGEMFLDVLITSMCFAKVEVNENGDVELFRIDPRDAIYEYIEGDDFLEKSMVKGARQVMSVEQILLRYDLNDNQRNQLNNARQNPDDWIARSRGYSKMESDQLMCDIIHIEWDGVSAEYWKEGKENQLYSRYYQDESNEIKLTDGEGSAQMEIKAEKYERTKKDYDKIAEKEGFKVNTRWKKERYEATRIGGIIDVNCRKKPFQPRNNDNPTELLSASYVGLVFGTTDGVRISLQQEVQNFDNMFDICMFQILKELARAKGKVAIYDRALMPENSTLQEVVYRVENDSFLDINSARAGYAGRQINPADIVKELDLGLSQSFQYLLQMKQDIMNNLNQITGINPDREGDIAASSTAMNAQSAITNSRTITEPMFFAMNEFVQLLLKSVVDHSSISWAFYKTEKGEQILGADKFRFLKVTHEVGYQNYGVHIEDGSRYMDIANKMQELIGYSLNAKEIRPLDALKFNLAETMAEKKIILEESWAQMQAVVQQSQERDLQAQNQMAQAAQQNQIQIQKDFMEDQQSSVIDQIVTKGKVQIEVDNNKTKGKMFENNAVQQAELLNNKTQNT